LARERRGDAAITALAAQHDELRTAISVIQQATQNLKREVARVTSLPSGPSPASAAAAPPSTAPGSQFDDVDSHKYVGFEDRFRGSREEIGRRVTEYLPIFSGTDQGSPGAKASDVLDVGCGRGEFLELMREHGISARGIDLNPAMVEVCKAHGLDAEAADA